MLARKAEKNRTIKIASYAASVLIGVAFLLTGVVANASAQTALVPSGETSAATPALSGPGLTDVR